MPIRSKVCYNFFLIGQCPRRFAANL